MDNSKDAVLKALAVAVVFAVITTMIWSALSSSYVAYSAIGEPYSLFGLEAARLYISEFGVFEFLMSFRGYFAIMLVTVFVGCVLHHKWIAHKQ